MGLLQCNFAICSTFSIGVSSIMLVTSTFEIRQTDSKFMLSAFSRNPLQAWFYRKSSSRTCAIFRRFDHVEMLKRLKVFQNSDEYRLTFECPGQFELNYTIVLRVTSLSKGKLWLENVLLLSLDFLYCFCNREKKNSRNYATVGIV